VSFLVLQRRQEASLEAATTSGAVVQVTYAGAITLQLMIAHSWVRYLGFATWTYSSSWDSSLGDTARNQPFVCHGQPFRVNWPNPSSITKALPANLTVTHRSGRLWGCIVHGWRTVLARTLI